MNVFPLNKILLAGIGAFVIIGAIIGVMVYTRLGGGEEIQNPSAETGLQPDESTAALPSQNQNDGNPPVQEPETIEQPAVPPVVRDQQELEIEQTAKNFVERFGSFSSQSNYAHAYAVMPLASARMQGWLKDMIAENAVTDISGVAFKGVMTRALGSRFLSRDDAAGKASVEVDTQRIETSDTDEQKIVIQPIRIELVKEDERWVVDGAFWGQVK